MCWSQMRVPGKTSWVHSVSTGAPSACCICVAVAVAVPGTTLRAQACFQCCTGGGQQDVQGVGCQAVMPWVTSGAQVCAFLLHPQQ